MVYLGIRIVFKEGVPHGTGGLIYDDIYISNKQNICLASVQMELTGRPPVYSCLKIKFSSTLKYLFVIIWLLYFILGKLSK